jgi:nucleoside triphosphatase
MRTIHRDIVGAFIFSSDNCILLGRSYAGGVYKGQWFVPGGGIEPGESRRQALIREMKEETGLDISSEEIEALPFQSAGESTKTLRDSGETVLVKMTFHDFAVRFTRPAAELELRLEDDLAEAKWIKTADLSKYFLSPSTANTLQRLGYQVTS